MARHNEVTVLQWSCLGRCSGERISSKERLVSSGSSDRTSRTDATGGCCLPATHYQGPQKVARTVDALNGFFESLLYPSPMLVADCDMVNGEMHNGGEGGWTSSAFNMIPAFTSHDYGQLHLPSTQLCYRVAMFFSFRKTSNSGGLGGTLKHG